MMPFLKIVHIELSYITSVKRLKAFQPSGVRNVKGGQVERELMDPKPRQSGEIVN